MSETLLTLLTMNLQLIWYDRNGEFVCAKRTPYKYPFHLADDMEIYRITFRKEVTIKILGE